MSGKNVLFEDGSKKVMETDSDDQLIISFTDNIVSSDGKKNSKVRGKGHINNAIAVHIFDYLESYNVATYFVSKLNERDIQVRKTEMYPITVQVHNVSTPALKKRYAKVSKEDLTLPLIEFYYGKDHLNDPVANTFTEKAMELVAEDELRIMNRDGLKINALIKPFFERRKLNLGNVKLQFGKYRGRIMLSSEITPDSCLLSDSESGDILSSERFDTDKGNVAESYRGVHERILGDQ